MNTFGIFQTYYETSLLKANSPSEISWIGTFQAFLLVALSLVVGPIFDRGYFRALIIIGTFLTVLGIMMTSLATQYWQVFLAQGLTTGLGTGCLFLPSVATVATYFTTKRALAIGIVASGGSIGSVIYPIVFQRLEPRIGFPWATRALGFIALGTLLISIAVMRARLPPTRKARAVLDLGAFKYAPFTLFSVALFLSFAGLYVPIFNLIVWGQVHAQIEADLPFYMLAILNAASAFGRVIPGLLADRWDAALELVVACLAIAGGLAYAAVDIHNLGGVVVFALLYGFVSGAVVSLPSAIVASLVPDMSLVGTWMGMSFCFAAVGILIGNPIAGTIIDVGKNQFSHGFIFTGSLVIASAALYLATKLTKTQHYEVAKAQ